MYSGKRSLKSKRKNLKAKYRQLKMNSITIIIIYYTLLNNEELFL